MKKLESISYSITMGAAVNLLINMLLVTVFKFGVILWDFDPICIKIGGVMVGYSMLVLLAAVYASSAINKVIKERRKELEKKKQKAS